MRAEGRREVRRERSSDPMLQRSRAQMRAEGRFFGCTTDYLVGLQRSRAQMRAEGERQMERRRPGGLASTEPRADARGRAARLLPGREVRRASTEPRADARGRPLTGSSAMSWISSGFNGAARRCARKVAPPTAAHTGTTPLQRSRAQMRAEGARSATPTPTGHKRQFSSGAMRTSFSTASEWKRTEATRVGKDLSSGSRQPSGT